MANSGFNFQQFINDSKAALLSPKEYFASMSKEGGFGEPVIKALIYGFIAGVFHLIWSLLNLTSGGQGMMFGGGTGIMALVGSIIFAVIGLFIGGIIILIISAICSGKTDFETAVRVTASIMVLSPVGAFLGFLTGLSFYLGLLVSLAISLYGIWMMFNALTTALQANQGTAKIVSIIIAIIPILIIIGALTCFKTSTMIADKYINESENTDESFTLPKTQDKEEMKKIIKNMMQEAAEKAKKGNE